MATAAKYRCKKCQKNVAAVGTVPTQMRYRKHDTEQKTECPNSRTLIPMWIIKRGPETSEDDRPKVGRDYGPCPACGRSPLLDDEGMYVQHIVKPGVPAAEQVVCDMTGKPYVSEGVTACPAPSDAAPEPKPSTAAPRKTTAPTRDAPAPGPNESEEMISKWAKTARQIEDRELPPPSPESTTTPPDSPQPCHIAVAHPPHDWMHKKQRTPCPGKPAPTTARTESAPAPTSAEGAAAASEAAPSITSTSEPPPDIAALAAVFPKATPAADAEPIPTASVPTDVAAAAPAESPFVQPGSPFVQPGPIEPAPAAVPMTVMAERVAARMKELFFSYDNRRSADNRSAQTALGPSEIGTPCDRRIAMSLLRIPPVNPGGDGWAAFVGTCVHAGLAEMFMWADAGTGRFAVETPLTFPSELVPLGTSDLLDRTVCMVDDHKVQGKWSQNKLRTEGIPPGYRVQLHTYGFGKRLQGEQVEYVALISWPREASSLDDLYVVVEPYDPQIARDALERVDRIAAELRALGGPDGVPASGVPRQFAVADDCRYCPFFAPGDAAMERGCNGRQ